MLPIRTILHPTDFSEHSTYAFQLSCSLARDYGARVILLHVNPILVVRGEPIPVPPEPPHIWEALQEQVGRVQPSEPGVALDHLLTEGDPAAEILRLAREKHCDLIVLGTHGRTGVGRLLMGSVAEEVLRRAPCPVLTVKAPPQKAPPASGIRQEPATV